MTSDAPRFQHVVLMQVPDAAEPRRRRVAARHGRQLAGADRHHVASAGSAADLTGERSQGWHYLLHTVFADEAQFQDYVVHPVHQELVAFLNERQCERLAFDYYF